jgi:hypothetical protein
MSYIRNQEKSIISQQGQIAKSEQLIKEVVLFDETVNLGLVDLVSDVLSNTSGDVVDSTALRATAISDLVLYANSVTGDGGYSAEARLRIGAIANTDNGDSFGHEEYAFVGSPTVLHLGFFSEIPSAFNSQLTRYYSQFLLLYGTSSINFNVGPLATTRVQFSNTAPYAYKSAGGVWGTLSDSRLKQSITEINGALDKILTLHPVHYEFINQGENANPSGTRTGFIAQEFEQVLPGHTFEMEPMTEADKALLGEGVKAKGIEADLVPYLVKAIQELKAELDTVKAELATLKG